MILQRVLDFRRWLAREWGAVGLDGLERDFFATSKGSAYRTIAQQAASTDTPDRQKDQDQR